MTEETKTPFSVEAVTALAALGQQEGKAQSELLNTSRLAVCRFLDH